MTIIFFFFFQAEDGIRGFHVTGVQTCALPILGGDRGGDARPLQQEAGLAVGEPDEGASGAVGIARAGYLLRAVEGGGEQGGLVAGGGGPRGDQRGQPEGEGDGDGAGERASAHSSAPFGRPTRGDTGTTIEGAVSFRC